MTHSLHSTEPTKDPMMYDRALVKAINTPYGSHIRALCYLFNEPGITYTFNLNTQNPTTLEIEKGLISIFGITAADIVLTVNDL